MLLIFQILFAAFVTAAIANIIYKKREQKIETRKILFLVLFWIIALLAIIWPESTTMLANILGIGRGTDLILYIAVAIIFYLMFKLYIKVEYTNKNITKIVRKNAISRVKKKNKST